MYWHGYRRGMNSLASPIDISPVHRKIVCDILRKHLPSDVSVWVFGSRAVWTTKNSSDLDLALESESKLDHKIINTLEDAFEDSELPYTVDIIDLNQISSSFKKIVEAHKVFLTKITNSKNTYNQWKETIIDNLVEFKNGKFIESSLRTENGLYPIYGSNGAIGKTNRFLYEFPVIVIGRVGAFCGSMSKTTSRAWITDNAIVTIPKRDTDLNFLFYLFLSMNIQNYAIKSAQPLLTQNSLKHIRVKVPTYNEQKAIGKILSDLDSKIELNRRINQTLEEISRALFKSWFVDFEPVRAKMDGRWKREKSLLGLPAHLYDLFPDNLTDSKFGEIPEGWTIKDLTYYSILNPESWSRTKAPEVIEYVDLSNTKLGTIHSTQHYIWNDAPSRAQRVLRLGDTIIGTVRPGKNSYALIGRDGLTGSTGFVVLRPKHDRYREFVYLASTNSQNIKRLAHHANGAAYPAVSSEIIMNTSVAFSNDNVLDQFSCMVSPLINKILKMDAEVHVLSNLRDVLLPKLMLGELQST